MCDGAKSIHIPKPGNFLDSSLVTPSQGMSWLSAGTGLIKTDYYRASKKLAHVSDFWLKMRATCWPLVNTGLISALTVSANSILKNSILKSSGHESWKFTFQSKITDLELNYILKNCESHLCFDWYLTFCIDESWPFPKILATSVCKMLCLLGKCKEMALRAGLTFC